MIYVVTHKRFDDQNFCKEGYTVLHVGNNTDCKETYLRDDQCDNIAYKNANYCELTGMYWLWKNAKEKESDIIGLIHYRRGFTKRISNLLYSLHGPIPKNLDMNCVRRILNKYEAIVPVPEYSAKTVYKSYKQLHYGEDLLLVRKAIKHVCCDYLSEFDKAMNSHHYFNGNMIITTKKLFDAYTNWLFSVFDVVEKHIDMDKYDSDYQRRVFGFLSERLLAVWLSYNDVKYKKMPIYNTEIRSENILSENYKKLKRKLRG